MVSVDFCKDKNNICKDNKNKGRGKQKDEEKPYWKVSGPGEQTILLQIEACKEK